MEIKTTGAQSSALRPEIRRSEPPRLKATYTAIVEGKTAEKAISVESQAEFVEEQAVVESNDTEPEVATRPREERISLSA